ncbi:RrF2 family transcriptional regulator [Corynebacterium anserum]|uniref:Transcriptional regulator n=1 Tax=Corynebacterium anserum TaxID=2684406 RepID=A0A7G7YPH6_9CORY|nr:Rrf2 family transcriptional regulator [Corynebacterium anserum]MBC2682024.1 transcriptional regulator [Corynebacterium anserum]QNH96396.1 transcriptional regulator [Corynebacterium anserum]
MHLTRSTNLGLQIVMELADQQAKSDGAQRLTAANISAALEASPTHVAKLASRLVEIGILKSSRGRTGGITIADGALNYPLGKLIRQLEGKDESVDRFIHAPHCEEQDKHSSNSPLETALTQAQEEFYSCLDQKSIADILPAYIAPTEAMLKTAS